jgi:hypothetical protein
MHLNNKWEKNIDTGKWVSERDRLDKSNYDAWAVEFGNAPSFLWRHIKKGLSVRCVCENNTNENDDYKEAY